MFDLRDHGALPHPRLDAQFYDGVAMRRLAAFGIDTAAALLIGVLVAAAFGVATLGLGLLAFVPAVGLVGFLYRWLSIARWSATPGMLAAGIELRRYDGARFDARDALIHTLLFGAMTLAVLPQIASMALMATSPVGRGAHDMLLGSTAINRPL
ncbi:MAG: RDD family protein [Rubrimonas sp.]|uniref:RDD family protein n=1 Tax=Rubrimonas sp. TaxID=2036015 RepID=UPI002FDC8952